MIDAILGTLVVTALGLSILALVTSQVVSWRERQHTRPAARVEASPLEADLDLVRRQVIAELERRQEQYFEEERLHARYRAVFNQNKEASTAMIRALSAVVPATPDAWNLQEEFPSIAEQDSQIIEGRRT